MVGPVSTSSPDLLTIHYIVITLLDGRGPEGGQIRPGIRFTPALAIIHLTPGDGRKQSFLLFIIGKEHQGGCKHPDTENVYSRRPVMIVKRYEGRVKSLVRKILG